MPTTEEVFVAIGSNIGDSVTIVVLVAPVEGMATCPSNPWHPITVTLDAPLGDRQLLDGHRHPPEPVGPAELFD